MTWLYMGIDVNPVSMILDGTRNNQHGHTKGPFYWHFLTLIPAWISNYMPCKVWDEITYPFRNFNGCTVEVSEWMNNFIPHFINEATGLSTWIWSVTERSEHCLLVFAARRILLPSGQLWFVPSRFQPCLTNLPTVKRPFHVGWFCSRVSVLNNIFYRQGVIWFHVNVL